MDNYGRRNELIAHLLVCILVVEFFDRRFFRAFTGKVGPSIKKHPVPTFVLERKLELISMKSALHYACEEGKTNAVAALLESGPDIDLQDNEGHTPLHKAAVRGHLAVVKLLRMVFKFSRCHFIVDSVL